MTEKEKTEKSRFLENIIAKIDDKVYKKNPNQNIFKNKSSWNSFSNDSDIKPLKQLKKKSKNINSIHQQSNTTKKNEKK